MFGNWRWNLGFGIFGFLLITLFALSNNPLITALIRGTYAFITFFLIAFPIRFVFGSFIIPKQDAETAGDEVAQKLTGTNVNLVTPDEDEDLNDVLKAQISQTKEKVLQNNEKSEQVPSEQFQPLKPTQLVSTDKMQSEELTKVIRHLTGE